MIDDTISRQAAIDALGDMVMNWTDSDYELGQLNQWKEDRKAIIDLPSAQPQRIKGKWVRISPAGIYECSICGKNVMTSDIDAYDYCHGCGNPMEVIRDENQTGPNDEAN